MAIVKRKEFFADASLFVVACIWGATFIIVKQAVETTPVYSFLFMRFGLAALLLLAVNSTRLRKLTRRTIRDGVVLGTVLFLVFAFQTYGLTTTPASVTAFITGLYVIFVPLILSIWRLSLPSRYVTIGVVLSLTGLALVTLNDSFSLSFGEFLVLICALFCAIHIIFTDTFSKRNDFALLTMVQIAVVSFLSMIFSLYYDPRLIPRVFDQDLIVALVVTSVFATVVAFGVQTAVQKFTSPSHTAIIFTMEPVAAAIFSGIMGETILTLRQYSGGLLIVFAMILAKMGPDPSEEDKVKS